MRKTRVYARRHIDGMAIHVDNGSGSSFVTTHRKNNRLYFHLCDEEQSLLDLKTYKPGRNKAEQGLRKSLNRIVKLTEYVLAEEAA